MNNLPLKLLKSKKITTVLSRGFKVGELNFQELHVNPTKSEEFRKKENKKEKEYRVLLIPINKTKTKKSR